MELHEVDVVLVVQLVGPMPFRALHVLSKLSIMDEILDFFLHLETIFSILIVVSMILAIFGMIMLARGQIS